jgi:hypothetical protein
MLFEAALCAAATGASNAQARVMGSDVDYQPTRGKQQTASREFRPLQPDRPACR